MDLYGRTALIAVCDPDYWKNLNGDQMDTLHSIDTLEDLVYAGASWETKDKRGLTASDVCPDWLKEVFDHIYSRVPHDRQ